MRRQKNKMLNLGTNIFNKDVSLREPHSAVSRRHLLHVAVRLHPALIRLQVHLDQGLRQRFLLVLATNVCGVYHWRMLQGHRTGTG